MFVCNDEMCPWGTSSVESDVQCGAKEKVNLALREYFKYSSFQLDAVLPALHKDVFVRMATGSGRSLCMYLVPLATNNSAVSVVKNSLIGLIGQQVGISVVMTKKASVYNYFWCAPTS